MYDNNMHGERIKIRFSVFLYKMIFIAFGTPRPRWVDCIKIDLKVIDLERADWINMAEGKEGWYSSREDGIETLGFKKFEQFCDWETLSFPKPLFHQLFIYLVSSLVTDYIHYISGSDEIIEELCVWNRTPEFLHYEKGKAIPLQAWTGPEDSRRLRLPDFMTIGTWRC